MARHSNVLSLMLPKHSFIFFPFFHWDFRSFYMVIYRDSTYKNNNNVIDNSVDYNEDEEEYVDAETKSGLHISNNERFTAFIHYTAQTSFLVFSKFGQYAKRANPK